MSEKLFQLGSVDPRILSCNLLKGSKYSQNLSGDKLYVSDSVYKYD